MTMDVSKVLCLPRKLQLTFRKRRKGIAPATHNDFRHITETPRSFHPNPNKLSPKAQNLSRAPNPITRHWRQNTCWPCLGLAPGWIMRDKFLCNSQALSAFPILGAGGQGATTFAAASCCPFFSFGSPFLHTRAPGTTQHACSKFKQRVMRKCVAMTDRLKPLRVQPSPSETCWNVTKCHACHAKRSYATCGTSKSNHGDRHRHGHTALTRPPADGWEHKRNVERTHPQPQTPRVKREPLLRIREKANESHLHDVWQRQAMVPAQLPQTHHLRLRQMGTPIGSGMAALRGSQVTPCLILFRCIWIIWDAHAKKNDDCDVFGCIVIMIHVDCLDTPYVTWASSPFA